MTCIKLGRSRSVMQALGMTAQGLAAAVCCELRDAGMQLPAWDTCAAGDTLLDCRVIAPRDTFGD